MIRVHQDFQGRHYYAHFGGDPDARETHRDELTADEWVLAERFADEWDQKAFDPAYDTLPLEHFEPLVPEGHRHGADVGTAPPQGRDGFPGNLLRPGLPCATRDECHVCPRERRAALRRSPLGGCRAKGEGPMFLYSRGLTLGGSPRQVTPLGAARSRSTSTPTAPLDVSAWNADFGQPIGTVVWNCMVESQARSPSAMAPRRPGRLPRPRRGRRRPGARPGRGPARQPRPRRDHGAAGGRLRRPGHRGDRRRGSHRRHPRVVGRHRPARRERHRQPGVGVVEHSTARWARIAFISVVPDMATHGRRPGGDQRRHRLLRPPGQVGRAVGRRQSGTSPGTPGWSEAGRGPARDRVAGACGSYEQDRRTTRG